MSVLDTDWVALYSVRRPVRPPRRKQKLLPCFEYNVLYSDPYTRQSSHSSGDASSPGAACSGDAALGPGSAPPPPPPLAPGGFIPGMRISTEIPEHRGRSPKPCAPGEPPAAIQNAMMTKDKKPFTYTPGGLDLSQIRSPRIQRRINRNINDEGVGAAPAPAPALPPTLYPAAQPGVVPPPPPPPPQTSGPASFHPIPHAAPPPYAPPLGGAQAPVSAQAVQMTAANLRPTGIAPLRRDPPVGPQHQSEPGSLYVAPVPVSATPTHTPVAAAGPRSQLGSLYIPPVDAVDSALPSPSSATPPPPPQRHFNPQSPQANLNKAPTPWISSLHQQALSPQPSAQPGSRIIPIQIEGREPSQPPPQQDSNLALWQQRQQQLRQQQQVPWRTVQSAPSPSSPSPQAPGERVIPIHMEGGGAGPGAARHFQPPQGRDNGSEWGMSPPVQSQSFRVLQKITGTDRDGDDIPDGHSSVPRNQQPGRQNDLNAAQLRKLQLNEDDRALMNKFKAQVDDEIYLHQESDPRYRGASIPSRAFRMLQNMTGADDGMAPLPSRISPAVRAAQQSMQESAAAPSLPASEQTAPEPRKYTGGAIPSRSFRMLQAMTAGSGHCAMNPSANGRETPLSGSLPTVYDAYGAECDPVPVTSPNPSQTGTWAYQSPEQQQQFWEHYNAMCAYMADLNAALGYGPVPFPTGYHYPYDPYWGYHNSDSEDYSGYSSTDEMSYYGAKFARNGRDFYLPDPYGTHPAQQQPHPPSITITPTTDPDTPTNEHPTQHIENGATTLLTGKDHSCAGRKTLTDVEEDSEEDESSGTDTETEDKKDSRRHFGSGNALHTIRSVPNVHVYSDSGDAMDSMTSETDDQTEDDYDGDDDVIPVPYTPEETYPHQLSVILEESDISDAESVLKSKRNTSSAVVCDSLTGTANSDCCTDEELGDVESTVMVRLPLRLKFSRSENDEEVTTVIVGDSQVRRTSVSSLESPEQERTSHLLSLGDQDDVSVTVTIPTRSVSTVPSFSPEITESIIGQENEDETSNPMHSLGSSKQDTQVEPSPRVEEEFSRKQSISMASPVENLSNTSEEEDRTKSNEESDCHWEDDSSSTSIQTVRGISSEQEAAGTADELDDPVTLKRDPEENEVEDFEWGEDGTLRTITLPKKSSEDFVTSHEGSVREDATTSEHSEVLSDDDELSSASSSDSSSSSSSSSTSDSNSDRNSEGSNRSFSLSRNSTVSKCEVEASRNSLVGEDEDEVEVEKNGDAEETCTSSDEDSENDGEELESDSKPEEVEQYVRAIISNMKLLSRQPSNDDEAPVPGKLLGQPESLKAISPDLPEHIPNDKADLSKGESEEDDSGVTSDMSRHISEAETEDISESHKPRKISKYQRAQTHSRLFRLLQDESLSSYPEGDAEEIKCDKPNISQEQHYEVSVGSLSSRKECLSLPLGSNTVSDPDSLSSSSGITSPASPTITDRLVKELVHTLLQRKKGKRLRKVPIAKVQAAALRILQEDMDPYDTLSSTSEDGSGHFFRSSVKCRVPPSHTSDVDGSDKNVYGTNYLDYRHYYETWDNDHNEPGLDYDIMPSRAFKLLDQHTQPSGFSPGVIEGLWAKCPRVRSFKNVKDAAPAPSSSTSPDPNSNTPTPQPDTTCTMASGREDK